MLPAGASMRARCAAGELDGDGPGRLREAPLGWLEVAVLNQTGGRCGKVAGMGGGMAADADVAPTGFAMSSWRPCEGAGMGEVVAPGAAGQTFPLGGRAGDFIVILGRVQNCDRFLVVSQFGF